VNLEDARVPSENLLGEVGKGHLIAFNILNIGRLKLGVSSIAGAKRLTGIATEYAKQRHQFGVSIASFGLIKHKLAEMAIRAYVGECMIYRTVGMIEEALSSVDRNIPKEALKAIEDYAVECSIIKVIGSEYLSYACDEAVQVFGGNGYSSDYPVERAYRDSRISRIYEGTNEINRLIIAGQILRRAAKGENALFSAAKQLQEDLLSPSIPEEQPESLFGSERAALTSCKKAIVAVLGSAALKYRDKASREQEVLAAASDMIIDVFAMESAILRTEKLAASRGEANCALQIEATRVFASDAIERIERNSKHALAAMAEGDELRTMLAMLRRFMKFTPVNTIAGRRKIAESITEAGKYNL
jgi:hypothetical protein